MVAGHLPSQALSGSLHYCLLLRRNWGSGCMLCNGKEVDMVQQWLLGRRDDCVDSPYIGGHPRQPGSKHWCAHFNH